MEAYPFWSHSRQCPAEATYRLIWCVQAWTCSSHSLAYVCPSEPHTGWADSTHSEGHTQRPVSTSHRDPKRHCPHRSGGGSSITTLTRSLLPTQPTCPPLTTGSSASHLDFPPKGTGHGFQLAHTAVSDTITAAHRIVDIRAHPLALAHGFPILHCAYCPKCTLHSMAWGWGLVWRGCGTQSTFSSICGQSSLPCNSPSPGWEWWRKS